MKLLNFLVFLSEHSPPNSIKETEKTSLAWKWVHSISRAWRQLHNSASQNKANLPRHRHAGMLKTNKQKKGGEEGARMEREENKEEKERRRKETRKGEKKKEESRVKYISY